MNRRSTGFTLIELMMVVAIIAVVAAIAIPSKLRSRISANHLSAIASLDVVMKMNVQFRSNDSDRNGTNDFWVENVWVLYGVKTSDGELLKMLPESPGNDWCQQTVQRRGRQAQFQRGNRPGRMLPSEEVLSVDWGSED